MLTPNINATKYLLINTLVKKLEFYQGSRMANSFPIAVGKAATPTPSGQYKIATKIYNPGSGLGTRWLGLSIPEGHYGIHGTNKPLSIGRAVSNGCIRMHNEDVEKLFSMVTIGTPVVITEIAEFSQPEQQPETTSPKHQYEYTAPAPPIYEQPEPTKEQEETVEAEAPTNKEQWEISEPEQPTEVEEEEQSQPNGFYYIVKPGDTLWAIARKHGLPIQKLFEANNLPNPNMIRPGQKVFVPKNYHRE
ncbi:MAG: LysM peptidoglycan-binding domain-containing protein [Firmicutes bacterium]|nr:LysM peptidoglycan-binding domain-containing protein [Bacillota bacterium]